ncbi:MAG: phenylalanine--tRNA ligase subunit beta [Kiritimatiellae bacterium]|nr:phenylalanine--tRNA ligase subunit beta [Kiritimatiellia bacterium]
MKLPISWLNEYVDVSDLPVQELAAKLTFSGIEVEGIEEMGANLDDHFVVGEVITCEPHENSDHLSVCSVFDGIGRYQVVCGASNCRAGIKVPFARVGAVIPRGGFTIKKTKLRGVASFGMICSAAELNLAAESDGIMILDPNALTGAPMCELLPAAESVLDLEITWNRPDCLSIIGVAREFAALLKRPLKLPSVDFTESDEPVEDYVQVKIEAPELCSRYTARVLTGVREDASPLWMQRRLEMCGIRAISLAVDVTNYVMLEVGQPLHAFDYRKLAEQRIVVRRAGPGESITTLDGVTRKLDSTMLVIADAREPIAVAGVMGGAESEIEGDSQHVLIESALFDPSATKFTAEALALSTESSRRFERGVDPDLADWASRRATALMVEHGGAKVALGVIDCDYRCFEKMVTPLRFDRARQVIGVVLSDDAMIEILNSLGLQLRSNANGQALFEIPSYRLDLSLEADLIEEIARMHGLDNVPANVLESASASTLDDTFFYDRKHCREILTGMGFTEAMHYSFLSAGELDAFDKRASALRAVIPNPVSGDYGVLRDSLLPQMAASLGRNASRQVESAALFEMGRVFMKNTEGVFTEEERLSIGMMGPFGRSPIDRRRAVSNEEALLWLKGAVENLVGMLHAGGPEFKLNNHPAMEDGWSADILLDGEPAGCMGLLSAKLRHQWRMTLPMPVAELRLAPLLKKVARVGGVKPVPTYPMVQRDVAFISDATLTHRDVVACIKNAAPAELTKVELFDIFVSKEIGKGKRSLGYTLSFRSLDRTLTDHEVNQSFVKIVQALKDELKVDIREG